MKRTTIATDLVGQRIAFKTLVSAITVDSSEAVRKGTAVWVPDQGSEKFLSGQKGRIRACYLNREGCLRLQVEVNGELFEVPGNTGWFRIVEGDVRDGSC